MKIAIYQFNAILGDFTYNADQVLKGLTLGKNMGCDLVLFPEAALFGYHPVDLLERPDSVKKQMQQMERVHKKMPEGIGALVGAITLNPQKNGKAYLNAAVFLQKNKKPKIFAKQLLPTYDVFDEARHIEPGETKNNILKFRGHKFLVTICEDIWAWPLPQEKYSRYRFNPLQKIKGIKFDAVLNLSASPFTDLKYRGRRYVTKKTAQQFKAPMFYANLLGAQDELIFDGASFVIDKNGNLLAQAKDFEEDFIIFDLDKNASSHKKTKVPPIDDDRIRRYRKALVIGLRDFCAKLGLNKVHLGLSGGIDSALVACIACEALGPENVTVVAMPSQFNSAKSLQLAKAQAKNLGCHFYEIPIQEMYRTILGGFQNSVGNFDFQITNENMQARIRGMLLMAYSNLTGSILLNTSNKSELAMGYSTLYGDLCGGLCVIGDLVKGDVYDLARDYNSQNEIIPKEVITRPPSAELRPNQKDEDSLPPYALLDKTIEKLVESYQSPRGEVDKRVVNAMMKSEFKRWQAPPILKVTDHAFGRGRRLPIAHRAFV